MILDVLRALRRRWYVLIVGLLLTGGLAYGAYKTTPPEYTARGLVMLLPAKASIGAGGNPFLSLSGLEQPASIVVAYFASTAERDEIADRAPNAEFEVVIDSSTRGPVIAVTVTDNSPAKTLSTLNYITDQIPVQLQRLQQEVSAPPETMVTSAPLVIDESAEANRAGTIRMVIAATMLGLVATCVAAFTLDGMLLSRRARRRDTDELTLPDTGRRHASAETSKAESGSRRTRLAPTASVNFEPAQRGQQIRLNGSSTSARERRGS